MGYNIDQLPVEAVGDPPSALRPARTQIAMTGTAQGDEIEARAIARAICVDYRLNPQEYERHGGERPIIHVIVRHVEPALASLRESLAKAEEARSTWHRLAVDIGMERDAAEARALLAESKLAEAKRALGAAGDWSGKLDELYSWSGSAFLAGEKVKDEAGHKSRLYGFLCGLIGYLMVGRDAATQETRHDG